MEGRKEEGGGVVGKGWGLGEGSAEIEKIGEGVGWRERPKERPYMASLKIMSFPKDSANEKTANYTHNKQTPI